MSKFSCFFFWQPHQLNCNWNCIYEGTTSSKTTWTDHYDRQIRNTEPQSCPIYYSFLEVLNCVAPFTSHIKLHEFGAEKPISWAKLTHFDFFTINFTVWSHIWSIGGDVFAIGPSSGAASPHVSQLITYLILKI